jgi:hypothetical protein
MQINKKLFGQPPWVIEGGDGGTAQPPDAATRRVRAGTYVKDHSVLPHPS